MLFLTRAAETVPTAMAYILKKNAVSVVIKALQAIHSNAVLQHKGQYRNAANNPWIFRQ